jgi:GntR family transcriptional regulator of arabinose operon
VSRDIAKHRQVYETIHRAIQSGEYPVGARIPTESELSEQFSVSRPTVSRALRDLEQQGYLVRRRRLGTFVREHQRRPSGLLGLTVPRTEGGILAPICNALFRKSQANGYGLLFGGSPPRDDDWVPLDIEEYCDQFISREVAGVFFLPYIVPPERMDANLQIALKLADAGIAVVLLDRDVVDFPARSRFDLIGVDNHRNGYSLTTYLLARGAKRVHFVTLEKTASTCRARLSGYHAALIEHGITPNESWVHIWHPDEAHELTQRLVSDSNADAYVCANDDIARELLHHFATLGVRAPEDVRVVGHDDLPFAKALPVALTTMRQPTHELGTVAVMTMLERLENPSLPARDIMLTCEIIQRSTCGGPCDVDKRLAHQVVATSSTP